MATIYLINNTQGALITTIAPTGENSTSTNLRLYGMGHLLWGEGVDENLLRLLEHFACPEKPLMPDFPQDQGDLGPGNGINNPVNGQFWYNTTKQRPYWYEAVSNTWIAIASFFSGPLPPPSPSVGTLWYDPSVQPCPPGGTSQLKVWNGVAFVSVALNYVAKCGDTMTGNLILTTVLPADPPLRAVTKQYVDDLETQNQLDFVNVAGDTMTGALTMSGAQINMGGNRIINVGDPSIAGDALNLGFADTRYVNIPGDTMTGALSISMPAIASQPLTVITPFAGATNSFVAQAGVRGLFLQVDPTGIAGQSIIFSSSGAGFGLADVDIQAVGGTGVFASGTLNLFAGTARFASGLPGTSATYQLDRDPVFGVSPIFSITTINYTEARINAIINARLAGKHAYIPISPALLLGNGNGPDGVAGQNTFKDMNIDNNGDFNSGEFTIFVSSFVAVPPGATHVIVRARTAFNFKDSIGQYLTSLETRANGSFAFEQVLSTESISVTQDQDGEQASFVQLLSGIAFNYRIQLLQQSPNPVDDDLENATLVLHMFVEGFLVPI